MRYPNNKFITVTILCLALSGCKKIEPERIVKVITGQVSEVDVLVWSAKGTIVDLGENGITQHGFCLATHSGPDIMLGDSVINMGPTTSKGEFSAILTGLVPATTYYVRAFASDREGSKYGIDTSFTTTSVTGSPVITTEPVINITQSSAQSGGNVTSEGGSTVTTRGVCWSTSPNPTLSNNFTADGSGTGTFISSLTGLEPATKYYLRAYATNTQGTAYGNEVSFTTAPSGNTVIDYDGNEYQIIQIGDQEWMAENLKVIHYADGTTIPLVEGTVEWGGLDTDGRAYCWYDNNTSLKDTYGALYTWPAAMKGAVSSGVQGVCPDGWHMPSEAEWKVLEMALGMSQFAADSIGWRGTNEGGKMKETGIIHWDSPNTGATNESGLTALPGGHRTYEGTFGGVGSNADFWTATESETSKAWSRTLLYSKEDIYRVDVSKKYGFSVRCIKGAASLDLPTVTTNSISEITESSASSGGEVTSEGGAEVTARGVCWSLSQNPTLSDIHTNDGSGPGSYTSSVTGLLCGETYYLRAYATNSAGTSYGNQVSFATNQCPLSPPFVTTATVTDVTLYTAESGGNVTNDGGAGVTARGVCWSSLPGPTTSDSKTVDGTGTGIFSSSLSGLQPFTTYYVRAYATNNIGTAYGEELDFKTLWDNSAVIDIDGNFYNTVQIGDQIWMVENLKVTRYADGSSISEVVGTAEWEALGDTDEAYCWHYNNPYYGDDYGALYTWAAAMKGAAASEANPSGVQGVCPTGWHLPSDSEWKQLEMYLGMSQAEADGYDFRGTDEGSKLKETGTTYWISPNTGATNESGFSARGSGSRALWGDFVGFREGVIYWSATESGIPGQTMYRQLASVESRIARGSKEKDSGDPVRCIKD